MRQSIRWTLVSLIALLVAGTAEAQTPTTSFGDPGHFAISGERMFGYVHTTQTQSVTGAGDTTTTTNTVSLLGSPISAAVSIYTYPRVAFDAFVAPGVSLGAAVTYFHVSESLSQAGSTTSGDASLSGLLLAPRIGFAPRLSPVVSLWLRAGITYADISTDSTFNGTNQGNVSSHVFAATIEAPLAVTLVPRVLLLIGPTADIGLSGTRKSTPPAIVGASSTSQDIKETDIGFQVGLAIFL
jgi:hypothetical protein